MGQSLRSCQIACADNETILHASVSQSVKYGGPILGALIFPNPHAQDIFPAIQIDSNGNIDCLFHNLPLAADMVVDGIQKYHRIDTLQGPLLPFPKSEKQTA